jgi:hypothetical protein
MNQSERFGVAILGFCLKHDASFRAHFLKRVCGADEVPDLLDQNFKISVDPYAWADVLLESERHVIVVECKVDAGLAEKQNPSSEAFSGRDGYGRKFVAQYSTKAGRSKALHYVVLMKYRLRFRERIKRGVLGRIRCLSETWGDLVRDEEPPSELERDLCDSLGSLGYAAFQFMKTRKTTIQKDAVRAAETMVILDNVAQKYGLRKLPWQFGISEDRAASSLGLDINWKQKIRGLTSVVRPKKSM